MVTTKLRCRQFVHTKISEVDYTFKNYTHACVNKQSAYQLCDSACQSRSICAKDSLRSSLFAIWPPRCRPTFGPTSVSLKSRICTRFCNDHAASYTCRYCERESSCDLGRCRGPNLCDQGDVVLIPRFGCHGVICSAYGLQDCTIIYLIRYPHLFQNCTLPHTGIVLTASIRTLLLNSESQCLHGLQRTFLSRPTAARFLHIQYSDFAPRLQRDEDE